jgi:hypothetical protein
VNVTGLVEQPLSASALNLALAAIDDDLPTQPLTFGLAGELCRQVDVENRRMRERDQATRPPVLMVFAPSTMAYGKLLRFLAPVLPTHRTIHLYLDEPPASLPMKHAP